MTANMLVKITDSGSIIYLTIDQARELRDFLVAEQSVTPVNRQSKALKS